MVKKIYKKVISKMRNRRVFNSRRTFADSQHVVAYCESYQGVQYIAGSSAATFVSSWNYHRYSSICGDSNSYLQLNGDFARVKMTRLEIFVTDATDTSYISQCFTSRVAPIICFAVYNTKSGFDIGAGVMQTDDHVAHQCGSAKTTYKSWNLTSKFVNKVSLAAGDWIDPLSYSAFNGQLSVGTYHSTIAGTGCRVANCRIRMTVIFSGRLS